jgi:hypothetical protein
MRYNEFAPHSARKPDTAPQTAKINAIKKRVADSEKKIIPVPAHMQAGFDFDDEQWGRQIEHELELAKKRYLQTMLSNAKRKQSKLALKDDDKSRKLVSKMAKRATRKKR